MTDYDVIVVGAGFAGIAAARECSMRGLRTLVLEARDRIGGRSGGKPLSDGTPADTGGTYVHWTQPHVWAEITRYGLTVIPGAPEPQWVVTHTEGASHWREAEGTSPTLRNAMQRLTPIAEQVFPNLAAPLQAEEAVVAADQLTLADGLASIGLSAAEHEALEASLTVYSRLPAEQTGWVSALRWYAMGGSEFDRFQALLTGFRIQQGTSALADAMLADGNSSVRLETPVRAIRATDHGVQIDTATDTFNSATAIIATPPGVWPHLDFTPPLPPAQFAAASEGMQAAWSSKAIALIRGESRTLQFQPSAEVPFTFHTQQVRDNDEQVITLFARDRAVDLRDKDFVRERLEAVLPHVTVIDSAGEIYRTDDPASRGAWGFLPPCQLTKYRPHENFTRLHDRVHFASSDIAFAHHGFIDGAIESGLRAAHQVRTLLSTR